MTRPPDLKNKLNRLVYIPKDHAENKLAMDVKALCIQDDITIRDFLTEAIELAFKAHHWPPGNPQLTLETSLLPKKQLTPHCKCGKVAVRHGLHLSSKRTYDFCERCFCGVVGRHDVKVWSWKT
jgi:hypothetical protein